MENILLAQYLSEDDTQDTEVLINIALILIDIYNKRVVRQETERRNRLWRYLHNRTEAELSMNMLLHIATGLGLDGNKLMVERRCWSLPKSRHWWENMVLPEWSDEFWLTNFRMTRSTFMDIAEQLRPFIEKEVTRMRAPITVEHRLAITLWRLATNIEYRSLGHLFGVGRSTVCDIVHETCRAIEKHLLPKHIRFPEGQDLLDTLQQFGTKFGFPQVVGAIDCSHISTKTPKVSPEDYFNQKQFYSVVLQAVVDANGRFIDTDVGQPGSVHDARVFSLSSLCRKLSRGTLFNPSPTRLIEGQEIPLLILGDPAYPLLPNLMKVYTGNGRLTRDQKHYNLRLSSARVVVEQAFKRLKGRWQILNKTNYHQLDFIRPLVHACCTLHNICEKNGDPFQQAWLSGIDVSGSEQHHRERPLPQASRIREALKEYLKTR